MGYSPIKTWDVVPPQSHGWGTPPLGPGMGYPCHLDGVPHLDLGWVPPFRPLVEYPLIRWMGYPPSTSTWDGIPPACTWNGVLLSRRGMGYLLPRCGLTNKLKTAPFPILWMQVVKMDELPKLNTDLMSILDEYFSTNIWD